MVFFGQVVEGADDGIEPLVAAEKAKNPDQLAVRRHRLQYGKFLQRGSAADLLHLCGTEERQRVIVNISHAVHILHVPQVTTGVHNGGDGLEALRAAQPAGDPCRQPIGAHIMRPHGDRFGKIETAHFPETFREVEGIRLHDRVKSHRQLGCRP